MKITIRRTIARASYRQFKLSASDLGERKATYVVDVSGRGAQGLPSDEHQRRRHPEHRGEAAEEREHESRRDRPLPRGWDDVRPMLRQQLGGSLRTQPLRSAKQGLAT